MMVMMTVISLLLKVWSKSQNNQHHLRTVLKCSIDTREGEIELLLGGKTDNISESF